MSARSDQQAAAYWLELAQGDLVAGDHLTKNDAVPPRCAASFAHMAAEKALKAVVARSGIDPQWTHDLVRLAQQARVRAELAVNGADLRLLTDAHIQAQYPDPLAPAYTADEALHLLDIASAIVAVAQRALAT